MTRTWNTVPKVCGADVELGNFIAGVDQCDGTGRDASRALLRALAEVANGFGEIPQGPRAKIQPQDWGRTFLPGNGGCAYIDLDHLELCLPEVLSAHDHVAAWHAMLRLAQAALRTANERQPDGRRIRALVNNSDGHGNSYGSHLNFLMTRGAWDDLIERKLHHLAWLTAYQASSVVFTGQGKIGSENGAPPATYQLSQRADFLQTLLGPQTTYRRPLVNTRDEPLCTGSEFARLHVICFDSTLCQAASLLKVGVMQIMLAMLEAGQLDPTLALEDPLSALWAWSRDPLLETRAPLVDGREVTAVELQLLFLEEALRFTAIGGCEGIVPRAAEILALWEDTLERLRCREWNVLARRLDWVLKLAMAERAMQQRDELDWSSPELKVLDHLYASLDPEEGLYWAWARGGLVDAIVPEDAVARFVTEPPEDTRAWGRAMLLRRAGPDAVDRVDWDLICFRLARGGTRSHQRLDMPNPLGFTRAELEAELAAAESIDHLLDGLGAEVERKSPRMSLVRIGTAAVARGQLVRTPADSVADPRTTSPAAGTAFQSETDDETA